MKTQPSSNLSPKRLSKCYELLHSNHIRDDMVAFDDWLTKERFNSKKVRETKCPITHIFGSIANFS